MPSDAGARRLDITDMDVVALTALESSRCDTRQARRRSRNEPPYTHGQTPLARVQGAQSRDERGSARAAKSAPPAAFFQ